MPAQRSTRRREAKDEEYKPYDPEWQRREQDRVKNDRKNLIRKYRKLVNKDWTARTERPSSNKERERVFPHPEDLNEEQILEFNTNGCAYFLDKDTGVLHFASSPNTVWGYINTKYCPELRSQFIQNEPSPSQPVLFPPQSQAVPVAGPVGQGDTMPFPFNVPDFSAPGPVETAPMLPPESTSSYQIDSTPENTDGAMSGNEQMDPAQLNVDFNIHLTDQEVDDFLREYDPNAGIGTQFDADAGLDLSNGMDGLPSMDDFEEQQEQDG